MNFLFPSGKENCIYYKIIITWTK